MYTYCCSAAYGHVTDAKIVAMLKEQMRTKDLQAA